MGFKSPIVVDASGELQQLQSTDQLGLDSPTVTTQPQLDNSTKVASTAYVDVAVGNLSSVNKLFIYYNFT